MKIVAALDSFKGSISSMEAGMAVKTGAERAGLRAEVTVRPLADGGEGTVEALVLGMGGTMQSIEVTGPLGEPVNALYGMIPGNRTAVLEMSQAAGITLVPPEKRNPLYTTTFGVGEMIRDALKKGCRRFIVGIGGSATNDGGTGMLTALGYEFLDEQGEPIPYGARGLEKLRKICDRRVLPELKDCEFLVACDVTNPLCGEQGCSAVYGPQKGADPDMIRKMDGWLQNYADLAVEFSVQPRPQAAADYPGAGAAGGLGFAFLAFTNGRLRSGVELVLEETGLEAYIREADLVITGEGRLDGQTVMGKAPIGVARLAKTCGKPVVALAGSVAKTASACNQAGIDAFFPVVKGPCELQEAMDPDTARENIAGTAEQVVRLLGISGAVASD